MYFRKKTDPERSTCSKKNFFHYRDGILNAQSLKNGHPLKLSDISSLKQEALNVINKMPDSVNIDDIMYRLYVIDKVRKGREASLRGEIVSTEELKKEIESW